MESTTTTPTCAGWPTRAAVAGQVFTEQHRRQLDLAGHRSARAGGVLPDHVGDRRLRPGLRSAHPGAGAGSSANSAVCYCLGITAVDPIKFHLLFERFLSEEREGYPTSIWTSSTAAARR
ncbi:MAG: hypothetical protein R3F43_30860 [bacterium]